MQLVLPIILLIFSFNTIEYRVASFFHRPVDTQVYLAQVKTLMASQEEWLIEASLEKYRHNLKLSNNFDGQVGQLIADYTLVSDPNAKRAIRASVMELSLRVKSPEACQFLDQLSLDPSIWQSERAILKQKADVCKSGI